MKKQLLLFLMILLPIVASADESGLCGENLTWTYKESTGTLTISGTGKMYGYTAGLSPWNDFKENIKSLVIEDGVTSIGDHAFYGCSGITSIIIPDNVTAIGRAAFMNCFGLASFKIGSSVNAIDRNAFQGCSSLASIDIPDGVKSIGQNAFVNCDNLFSVTLGNGLTSISKNTFSGCSNLKDISIGNNVITIGSCAFYGCNSLTSVTIPNSVTTIYHQAFFGCRRIRNLELGNHVAYIGSQAFSLCDSLTSLIIPTSVTSIDFAAFSGCKGITSLIIPYSVTYIGEGAFSYCSGLVEIKVDGDNSSYDSRDNCNAIIETISNRMITGCQKTQVPNSVTTIGELCFCGSNLSSLNIPNSIVSIEPESFSGCAMLSSLYIPQSVTSIGSAAFYGCRNLTSIVIPDGINCIESCTFQGCSKLSNVELGSGISTIKTDAFTDCHSLTTFTCRAENPPSVSYDIVSSSFYNTILSRINLFVPEASVGLYGETIPWMYFGKIRAIGNYFSVTLSSKGNGQINYGSDVIRNDANTYEIESKEGLHLSIVPDEGNSVESLILNGTSQGGNLTISIDNLTEDIDISVSFITNKYKLTYIIDGVVYKYVEYEYGATIKPEIVPTKEGYTFSGWSDIPETMPAKDVTVTGTFTINSYKLTYMIDEKVYKEKMYEFGATITPEPQPEGDYATFEWTDLPATMPAHDVTVYATYTSGIAEIVMMQCILRIYGPDGKPRTELQKGLNIVRMSDGTTKKIVVK